jgi:hypothetical protein
MWLLRTVADGESFVFPVTPRELKSPLPGVNLIGLAFGSNNEMVVASIDSVFSVPMQVRGTLLPRDKT